MRYLGSTIECYRGESFVVKRAVVDSNGVPFIVNSSLKNPFIRFTVKSNTYKIDGEQCKNYWIDISSIAKYNSVEVFPDNTIPEALGELSTTIVYYIITEEGNEYYVWNGTAWVVYEFLITKRFLNNDTKRWVGQIYQYEIALCSGELMTDWLQKTFESLYPNTHLPTANIELAHHICKKRPDLLKDVDITEPLVSYATNKVLQGPSKLIVKEN